MPLLLSQVVTEAVTEHNDAIDYFLADDLDMIVYVVSFVVLHQLGRLFIWLLEPKYTTRRTWRPWHRTVARHAARRPGRFTAYGVAWRNHRARGGPRADIRMEPACLRLGATRHL